MRNIHYPGRSVVMAAQGMVASSHPLSSQAGLDVLKQGGNALDAAIAACAVQCVSEPFATGIGGDCFLLYHQASSGQLFGLNGSGRAPQGATTQAYRQRQFDQVPERGIFSVTVPGAIDAWHTALERFGSKGLDELLQPAIQYAQQGYAISPVVAQVWQQNQAQLAAHNPTDNALLVNGAAPKVGSLHYQAQLAQSLSTIASKGKSAFYNGELAEEIVRFSKSLGGLLELDDFAAHQSEWVDPISTNYRGIEVFELPPNSQGLSALLMLNILQQHNFSDAPLSPAHVHQLSEAYKLAITERDTFITDPQFSQIPIAQLLSADYAQQLQTRINPHKALSYPLQSMLRQHRDTVYISVVDRDRNAASLINSLYYPFGSMLVAGNTGILLQNRAASFSLDEQHANCIAPKKRPMHTIIPAMAYRNGQLILCFGVMGGSYQAMGHAYVLSNWLDYGLDIQQAIDAPRFLPEHGKLLVEQAIPATTRRALEKMGHEVIESQAVLGGGQAIFIDTQTGVLHGGSDPRKDGCAIAY